MATFDRRGRILVFGTRDGHIYLVTSGSGGHETTLVRVREDGARDRSFVIAGTRRPINFGEKLELIRFR